MWTMAISQHQFYLDKKQVEVRVLQNQSESEGQGSAPAFPTNRNFFYHTNVLNMFKSGLTKQGWKLVANIVRTSQLNKVKTGLIKIC